MIKTKINALFAWILGKWMYVCAIPLLLLAITWCTIERNEIEISSKRYNHLIRQQYYYSKCCPEYSAQISEYMTDRKITRVEYRRLKALEEDMDLFLLKTRLR